MADGEILRTRALKVATTEEHTQTVLGGLIEALTGDPPNEWVNLTTVEFKLISFSKPSNKPK